MQMGTGYWLIAGYVLLACGSAMFLWNGYKALVSPFGRRMDHLITVLLSLYPMGVGFKASLIGPHFLRWHLSDIGFSVFVGFVLYEHLRSHFEKRDPNFGKDPLADTARTLRRRKLLLLVALLVSYAYEGFTQLLYSLRPDLPVQLIGKFDPWDIVGYTFGAALCYMLLTYWQLAVDRALTQRAEEEAAAKVERREQRRRRPRRQTRRRGKRR